MNFIVEDDMVIIPVSKAILVLTREEFVRALRRGKYHRRGQATRTREHRRLELAKREDGSHGL